MPREDIELVAVAERRHDREVQFPAALVQQRVVGHGLRERVPELVREVFAARALDEQAGDLQAAQRLAQFVGRQFADALDQADAGGLADGGERLQDVLVRA